MRININYLDNSLIIDNESINVLEIENKSVFYKTIMNFLLIDSNERIDDINFYDDDFNELNMLNKILVISDYFNINFDSKKYLLEFNKLVLQNINDEARQKIVANYNKIFNEIKNIVNGIDIPLSIDSELNMENLLKLFKISVNNNNSLLNNLFLLIDIESMLNINKIIIFINLKQFLSIDELEELYKYSLSKDFTILLIDSQCYGTSKKFEKKLVIDENLDEFML